MGSDFTTGPFILKDPCPHCGHTTRDDAVIKRLSEQLNQTITIPVAEYERLQRLAFSKDEMEVLLEWASENNNTHWHHYDDEVWNGIKCRLAAIKEQEG